MKTINDITLHDLMAEEIDVWIEKNSHFGFDITLTNEENEKVVIEKGIHACAMDGFADFCKRYLAFYDKALSKEVA